MVEKSRGNIIVKIGIYLRKSRAEDGVQDLKKHKDYLIEICNRNKWLYDLYEEVDSSQELNRDELQRLRKDIASKKIDAVMVHAVDRLSRRSRHFLEIIEDYFIAENMTTLYVKDTENNLLDTTTITMLQLQATLSQAEYSFIIARLKEGRKQSAKNGIWSGKIVFGYEFNKDSRKMEIVKDEAIVVRKICDMVLDGHTYGGICKKINKLGYKTRAGNFFDVHNIKSIINSPIIRGHVIVNWGDGEETLAYNSHESIINDSEYNQMRKILEKRSEQYTNISVAPKHFLQGLLRCSGCGIVSVVQASKKSTWKDKKRIYSSEYEYYVRKCRGKDCVNENYGCNVKDVEIILRRSLIDYSKQIEEKIKELETMSKEDIPKIQNEKIKELEKLISKIENKEESLLDLLVDGTISKDIYNKRIEKIKEEKSDLIDELNSMSFIDVEQENKQISKAMDLIENYDELDDEDKRRLLQMIFSKIYYTKKDKTSSPELDIRPN